MNVLIACGGTGGHLYPGLVVGKKLLSEGINVMFVVRRNDKGARILSNEKLRYEEIDMIGFPRKSMFNFTYMLFFYKLVKSLLQSVYIIAKYKIHVIISFGGYVSFPVAFAGKILMKPLIIHEQNVLPGMSNRILSFIADKIAISFHESEDFFAPRLGKKIIYTGLPIRFKNNFFDVGEAYKKFSIDPAKKTLLVFGGSAGAHKINVVVSDAMVKYQDEFKRVLQVIHITGEKDYEEIVKKYKSVGVKSCVYPYLDDIGYAYVVADFVISRAGASTMAEILYFKKPAIFVPYPYATDNHQKYNVLGLRKSHLCEVIYDEVFSVETVREYIHKFIETDIIDVIKYNLEKYEYEIHDELFLQLVNNYKKGCRSIP